MPDMADKVIEKVTEKAFDGATVDLSSLKREDGLATISRQQGLSFVNHLVFTAPKRAEELNEIILSLNFESPDEPDWFADAIGFCEFFHANKARDDVFRTALARSAGTKMQRARMGVEAITHSSFNFQGLNQNTQNKRPVNNSPIGDR